MQEKTRIQSQIDGEYFEVYPKTINKKLFKRTRRGKQEEIRKLILEAFQELERNPHKYSKPFRIIIPQKTWRVISGEKAQNIAIRFKGHITDWVEQAFEWAQRIHNGESWEDICNKPDKSKYYRIVVWKDGKLRIVGGANNKYSMTDVCEYDFNFNNEFIDVVPSIASQI